MASLVSIEGIGEKYADCLARAGIGSTGTLLDRGATRTGRDEIARTAGVTGHQVLAWVNRADLFRIDGIGEEFSDLLEASVWIPCQNWLRETPSICSKRCQ